MFLTTSVKPRTRKKLQSPYKASKKNSSSKEDTCSLKFGYIKSPTRSSSPYKINVSFKSPSRKKQRLGDSPFIPSKVISSTPKKSRRKLLHDHIYCKDNSIGGLNFAGDDDSFDIEINVSELVFFFFFFFLD